jgi:hypothetical protein
MNVDNFAQVPDLDHQLLNSSAAVLDVQRHSAERNLRYNDMNLPHIFGQAPYIAQEGKYGSVVGAANSRRRLLIRTRRTRTLVSFLI